MTRVRRVPVVIGVTLFTAALTVGLVEPRDEPVYPRPAERAPVPAAEITGAALFEERQGPVDLYGNEVTDAIATYGTDSGGAIYEEHAPDVELPKLGVPKS